MYDYDLVYSNLNLGLLEDEELYLFAMNLVSKYLMGLYLLGFTQDNGGVQREFDLDNYEVSELSILSANLVEGFTKTSRRRYQDQVDVLLFKISLFDGGTMSVKGKIKQTFAKEMRQVVRETISKRNGVNE